MNDFERSRNNLVFFKKKVKGNISRQVIEKYYRTDTECGYIRGTRIKSSDICSSLSKSAHQVLLLFDTNIFIHHMDVLENNCPLFTNFVVLETVLNEVKNLNMSLYHRLLVLLRDESKNVIYFPNESFLRSSTLRRLDENANDSNDR